MKGGSLRLSWERSRGVKMLVVVCWKIEEDTPSFYRDNINYHYPQTNPTPIKKKKLNKRGGAMATIRGQDYFGLS